MFKGGIPENSGGLKGGTLENGEILWQVCRGGRNRDATTE